MLRMSRFSRWLQGHVIAFTFGFVYFVIVVRRIDGSVLECRISMLYTVVDIFVYRCWGCHDFFSSIPVSCKVSWWYLTTTRTSEQDWVATDAVVKMGCYSDKQTNNYLFLLARSFQIFRRLFVEHIQWQNDFLAFKRISIRFVDQLVSVGSNSLPAHIDCSISIDTKDTQTIAETLIQYRGAGPWVIALWMSSARCVAMGCCHTDGRGCTHVTHTVNIPFMNLTICEIRIILAGRFEKPGNQKMIRLCVDMSHRDILEKVPRSV